MRFVRFAVAQLIFAGCFLGFLASSPAIAAQDPCKATEVSYEVTGYGTETMWATIEVRNRSKAGQQAMLSFEVIDRTNKAEYIDATDALMGHVPAKSRRVLHGLVGSFPQSYDKDYKVRLKIRCTQDRTIPLLPVQATFSKESPDDSALWSYTVTNTSKKWISKLNEVQIGFYDPVSGKLVGGCSSKLDYDLPPGAAATDTVSCNTRDGLSVNEWTFNGIPESKVVAKATIAVSRGPFH